MTDINKSLQQAGELLDEAIRRKAKDAQFREEREHLVERVSKDLSSSFKPLLEGIKDGIKESIQSVKIEPAQASNITLHFPEVHIPPIVPQINFPEQKAPIFNIPEIEIPPIIIPEIKIPRIELPTINVPEPKVTVNVPPIKIPDIQMPDEMNIKGWVSLMGVDLNNPLPVQLRDASGKPVNLLENLTTIVGGSGGGGHKITKISDIANSAWANLLNADGRLRTSVETGGGGLTDTELRASSVPIAQVSGANWSVSVNDSFRTTVASNLINSDDRLRVSVETGGGGLTDTELRASSVPIAQVSGAIWSVSVNDSFRTTVASNLINADDRLRVSLETGGSGLTDTELRASSVPIAQASGALWSVNVAQQDISQLVNQVSGANWSVTATATDLDIRDLVNASDSVSVYQVSGASWSVSVNDAFRTTVASNLINADDRLRVSLETGGSGLTDTELRASSVPISQVSGAAWSVSVNDAFRTTVASNLINSDDRLRVSLETGGSGLTDTELRASSVPVAQASGASWSTEVTNTVTVSATNLDIRDLANATDSISSYQVSGASWSVEATATNLDIRDLVNATDSLSAYQVSGASWSVNVVGASATVAVVGDTVSDAADNGGAPIKLGGIARTVNPTAVANEDRVSATFDDVGRQLIRPVQVRDLTQTAYVQKTSGSTFGTETSFIAGTAGEFHDLIYIMASNNSDAATFVDVRSGTGGSIIMTMDIPPGALVGVAPAVPIPQAEVAQAWTIDLPDITGTTISITGLFSKEI